MMPVNSNMAPSPQSVIANDSIKQKEEMTQDCSITLLLSPTKTTVFQRASTLLGLILHRVQEQKNYPVKSTDHTLIIHGSHREHGKRFQFKIFFKIIVWMSSINDAIHKNNPHQKQRTVAYFGQGFLFKDFGSRVIEYISCARAILKKDFLKDFLPLGN